MEEEIYRKKSLDKVKSPETLDDYIRVSNPGVWLLLFSVIILLAGACVWGVLGRVESTVPATVCVQEGEVVCTVAGQDITQVQTGMAVRFADREAEILQIGKADETGYVCALSAVSDLSDGFYEGKIVVKSCKPISFVLN